MEKIRAPGSRTLLLASLGVAIAGLAACDGPTPEVIVLPPAGPSTTPTSGAPEGPGSVVETPTPVEPDFSGLNCGARNPVPSEARLLTRLQYESTVRDLFHGRVHGDFAADFPAENQVLGFGTNAEFHRATPWLTEGHMTAAERVAGLALGQLAELLPCSTQAADEACAESFVAEYGLRAFRRPLEPQEAAPLLEVFRQGQARHGFAHGIELVIQSLLQSPQFLYRLETDRSVPSEVAGGYRLVGYELASRLSYFLWNSMPDEELLNAAALGALATPEQVEAQARRMLQSDKARATVADFHAQWLATRRFDSLVRQNPTGPNPEVADDSYSADWKTSLGLFLDHAFWGEGQGSVDALLNSKTVFLNPNLAALYGVALPEGANAGTFYAVEFEADRRSGLLTQPALLALLAHAEQSAPIQRGVFVRAELLCQPAPAAPPSVDPTPPDPDPNATTRERFAQHTADPTCAGCHQLIDPLGLGLEHFDQLGRYRADENGLPIDASGEVVATREEAIRGPFAGGLELAERLAQSEQVRDCMLTQWYRYSSGRVEQQVDLCSLAQIRAAFTNSGGDLREMLVAMALSDAFNYRTEPLADAEAGLASEGE